MDGKKRKKKELDGAPGRSGSVADTMYNVGGRVREGKPPKLWSKFWTWFQDTGHRGGGFNRFAHSAGPHQSAVGLLGCCVAVFLSCCPAVLPS